MEITTRVKKSILGLGVSAALLFGCMTSAFAEVQTVPAEQEETEKDNTVEMTQAEETVYSNEIDKDLDTSKNLEDLVIFGVDSRAKDLSKGTRSDSIMVVHLNHDRKIIKVMSIYRDTMMHIEGHGYQKVTHAHSFGGPLLGMSTINENLDLDIENYLTVNFSSVGDFYDELGGIAIDITEDECKYINGYIHEVNKVRGTSSKDIKEPGFYRLDGTQAVAYSRIRYTEGWDYKRSERQRDLLFKAFEKMKGLTEDRLGEIVDELFGEVNTNYPKDEIINLLQNLSTYEIREMTAFPEVFYGGTVEGAWVEVPCSLADMAASVHEYLFDETDYTASETVVEYSDVMSSKVSGPNNDLRDKESEE